MASDQIVVVDLIGEVVASMRAKGDIVSFIENSGTYALTSINTLKANEVINIDGIDYIVESVTADSFTIIAESGIDFAGKTWNALAPYYEYGHPLEIKQTLNEKVNDIYSFMKYPLIALFQDFTETIGDDLGNYATISPTLIIANVTRAELKADNRYDSNFRNVLYPLYNALMKAIYDSNSFYTPSIRTISHSKTDRLYWGTEEANRNSANKFSDYIDAIEITFNNLPIPDIRC